MRSKRRDRLRVVWLACPKNKQKRGQDIFKVMEKQQRRGDDDAVDEEKFRISSTNRLKLQKLLPL